MTKTICQITTTKPDYHDPSTWTDELVLLEYNLSQTCWTELMFTDPKDLIIPYPPDQLLEKLAFWQSRLELAEPEARKRKLI